MIARKRYPAMGRVRDGDLSGALLRTSSSVPLWITHDNKDSGPNRREAWDGPGRPVALPSVRRSGPEPGPVGRIAGYLLSSLEASGVTVLVDARPGDAAWGARRGRTLVSGRLAPEDPHGPDDDQLDDRPADEGHDGGDIEHRTRGMEGVPLEDPLERAHEHLAEVEDARNERIARAGVQQEQDDPQADHDLDQAEDEDRNPAGEFAAARPVRRGARRQRQMCIRDSHLLRGRRVRSARLVDGPGRHGGCPGWGPAACPPPAPSITNTRVQRWGGPRVRRASPGSVGAYGSDPLTAPAATGSSRLRSASSNSGPAQPGQAHVNSMAPAAAAALSSDGHTWLVSWVPHLVHVRTISISHLLVLASSDSPVWCPERNGSSPCTRPARPLHLDPDRGQVLGWSRVAEGLLGADGVVVSPGPRWAAPCGKGPDNEGGRTGGFLGGEFCDPEAQIERLLLLLNRSI